MISVSVKLTFNQYWNATYRIFIKRSIAVWVIMGLCIISDIGISIISGNRSLIIIAYPIAIIILLNLMAFIRTKQTWEQELILREPTTYELSEDGIAYQSDSRTGYSQWTNFLKLVDASEYLILFMDQVHCIILPKSSFSDSNHLGEFKGFVHDHLRNKKNELFNANKKYSRMMTGIWILIVLAVYYWVYAK